MSLRPEEQNLLTDTEPTEDPASVGAAGAEDEPEGIQRMQRQLADLAAGNQAALNKLGEIGVQFNPLMEVAIRLETLIDGVIPPGQRILFEIAHQERFAQVLANAVEEATAARRKALLTAGVRPGAMGVIRG